MVRPAGPEPMMAAFFAVGRRGTLGHLAGVGGRDVVFDDREVHRRTFDAAHAMALALVFVVADQRADRRQGVVLKQHTARFVELIGLQKADDLGNIGVDRAALLAAGAPCSQGSGLLRPLRAAPCFTPSFRTDFAR